MCSRVRDGIFFFPSPCPFSLAMEEESNAAEFIACFLKQNKPLAWNGEKRNFEKQKATRKRGR